MKTVMVSKALLLADDKTPLVILYDDKGKEIKKAGYTIEGVGIFDNSGKEYPAGKGKDGQLYVSVLDEKNRILNSEGKPIIRNGKPWVFEASVKIVADADRERRIALAKKIFDDICNLKGVTDSSLDDYDPQYAKEFRGFVGFPYTARDVQFSTRGRYERGYLPTVPLQMITNQIKTVLKENGAVLLKIAMPAKAKEAIEKKFSSGEKPKTYYKDTSIIVEFVIHEKKEPEKKSNQLSLFSSTPLEEGRAREAAIVAGIKKLAKKYKVGEIDPMHIDSQGNITMIQYRINPNTYKSEKKLDERLQKLARKFESRTVVGGISGRWIKLNHFDWEKLLRSVNLL